MNKLMKMQIDEDLSRAKLCTIAKNQAKLRGETVRLRKAYKNFDQLLKMGARRKQTFMDKLTKNQKALK